MRGLYMRKGSQRGIGMLETLLALGVLGFVGVAFMTALGVSFKSTDINDEQVTGENLVRTQLEYIRDQDYCLPDPAPTPSTPYTIPTDGGCVAAGATYDVPPPGVTLPPGYTITLEIAQYCGGEPEVCYAVAQIQKLTARVFHGGKPVAKIEDLKTYR